MARTGTPLRSASANTSSDDLRADPAAAVLGQERQVDEDARARLPRDPGPADRAPVEQDQLVRGVGEARLPARPLSAELEVEERLARRVVPAGDIGPRRRKELAQERLVGGGDRLAARAGAGSVPRGEDALERDDVVDRQERLPVLVRLVASGGRRRGERRAVARAA